MIVWAFVVILSYVPFYRVRWKEKNMVYVGFEMFKCVLSDDSRLIIWPILMHIDLLCLPCKIIFFSFKSKENL